MGGAVLAGRRLHQCFFFSSKIWDSYIRCRNDSKKSPIFFGSPRLLESGQRLSANQICVSLQWICIFLRLSAFYRCELNIRKRVKRSSYRLTTPTHSYGRNQIETLLEGWSEKMRWAVSTYRTNLPSSHTHTHTHESESEAGHRSAWACYKKSEKMIFLLMWR